MLCCWVEDSNSEAFKRHLPRVLDYLWIAEDGMKMQVRIKIISFGQHFHESDFSLKYIHWISGWIINTFDCCRKESGQFSLENSLFILYFIAIEIQLSSYQLFGVSFLGLQWQSVMGYLFCYPSSYIDWPPWWLWSIAQEGTYVYRKDTGLYHFYVYLC